MLLFLTNFFAILLAGGLVFMLSGLGQVATGDSQTRMRREAYTLIITATLLVAIPLTLSSYQAVSAAVDSKEATGVTQQWLEGTLHRVVSVNVNESLVSVTVEGTGELRPLKELADGLATTLDRPVIVTLRSIPTQSETSAQQ